MTTPLKPLAKKKFLAQTVLDMAEVLRDVGAGHTYIATDEFGHGRRIEDYSVKSLEQRDHAFFALTIFALANRMYRHSICAPSEIERQWGKWWQIQHHVFSDAPQIGGMVFVQDALFGNRQFQGVGQLIRIEPEPRAGARRLYEDDGGPARMSTQYVLRLLDGSEIKWTNARIVAVADHRFIQILRDIEKERRWTKVGRVV